MKLTDDDYVRAAHLLECDTAAIRAVAAVESDGDGFHASGRPKILFEAHVFSRLTGGKYDASHPNLSSPTWNRALYQGGENEHKRLQLATTLDRPAALQSASWGKFQIMGFNWSRCGHTSLQNFINAMYRDEADHLTAFCYFIKSKGLDDELRRLDWAAFACGYNGKGYAANRYDERLAKAYENFKAIDKAAGVRT